MDESTTVSVEELSELARTLLSLVLKAQCEVTALRTVLEKSGEFPEEEFRRVLEKLRLASDRHLNVVLSSTKDAKVLSRQLQRFLLP